MKDKDDEKFMEKWEKERARGKERYMAYRTFVLALTVMLGNAFGGSVFRGRSFHLDFGLFFVGLVGGAFGTSIAWKRDEERYLKLLEEQELSEPPERPEGSD